MTFTQKLQLSRRMTGFAYRFGYVLAFLITPMIALAIKYDAQPLPLVAVGLWNLGWAIKLQRDHVQLLEIEEIALFLREHKPHLTDDELALEIVQGLEKRGKMKG